MRCELLSANECTKVQSAILDEIKLCQQKDTQCRRIIDGKLNRNDERFNFTVENNIVYSNQRYFIRTTQPWKISCCSYIMIDYATKACPRLLNWLAECVCGLSCSKKPKTTCDNAHYINETNHQIPDCPWQSVAMDFITSLPKSNGFDSQQQHLKMSQMYLLNKLYDCMACHRPSFHTATQNCVRISGSR